MLSGRARVDQDARDVKEPDVGLMAGDRAGLASGTAAVRAAADVLLRFYDASDTL